MTTFSAYPKNHYGAILCDPPWRFATWNNQKAIPKGRGNGTTTSSATHYATMTTREIARLPVENLAAPDCALFLWCTWPMIEDALAVIRAWSFTFKTCAFDWMKAHAGQIDMLRDDADALMGMGYWTRANSEPCLLATRGKPKRLRRDVRMGIIEPRREHSRKPDCIYNRIERLVSGPYIELFARQQRPGWNAWGDELTKYNKHRDAEGSFAEGYRAVRERVANGGASWHPK
jgi:N6-adenosine-specific RNA methylase IME4